MTHDYTWSAEDVLPGHPDRICDAVAERIVEYAGREAPGALVGVEVALHRHSIFITGRVAGTVYAVPVDEWPLPLDQRMLEGFVVETFVVAGYRGRWAHQVKVVTDLDVGGLSQEEYEIRGFSDDQTISIGYADPSTPGQLPLETWLVRRLRAALMETRSEHHHALGPDGKVLVTLAGDPRTPRLHHVNAAIQHAPGLTYGDLHDIVLPAFTRALEEAGNHLDVTSNRDWLRLNGIGDFTCGGPLGDNGLSGKKIVVDHYGPQVPIGGGAICGKDAHKPDRAGALRARQLAKRLAHATGEAITTELGWLPGLEEPDRLAGRTASGTRLSTRDIANLCQVPDLSLKGTCRELELETQPWTEVLREGYFSNPERSWER